MAFLTKEEVSKIVSEAPEGAEAKDVIRGLRRRGHSLEGFSSSTSPIRGKKPTPQKQQTPVGGFLKGAAKGVTSTLQNIGQAAMATPALFPGGKSFSEALDSIKQETGFAEDALIPETTAENVGFTAEQFAEFLVPFGTGARAAKLASGVTKSSRLGRFGVRSVAESGELAMKETAQEGDFDSTAEAFTLGLAVNGVLGPATIAGRAATGLLPERLMSMIFKTSADDLTQAYKTASRGKELDPVLAREVLDRGLRGNTQNMAIYSIKKMDDLERRLKNMFKQEDKIMPLPNKKSYEKFLQNEVIDRFKTGFYRGKSRQAKALLRELQEQPSQQVNQSTALKLRRFVDDMRNNSSFRLDQNLAPKQEQFKSAADLLRKKLAKDPRISEIMNEYRIFIQAFDNIVDVAHKRSNKPAIGLIDILAGGGGVAAGSIVGGASAAVAIRGFQQPFSTTNLAAFLDVVGKTSAKTPQGVRDAMRAGLVKTGVEVTE